MSAAICCIAKLEGPYILEWVTYHLKLGFSRIYIYDNNNDKTRLRSYFSNREVVSEKIFNKVSIIHFPGKTKQMPAYNNFLVHFSNRHKWVAYLDCDEFIVLKNWEPITVFLSKYCQTGSLLLNWRLFGDSGRQNYSPEPVTQRFTMCDANLTHNVKSISICKDINFISNPHTPELKNGLLRDVNSNVITGNLVYNNNSTLNIAYVNHYFGKTYEEWIIKKNRGRSDIDSIRMDYDFHGHNKNDVEDLSAHLFYTDPNLDFSTSQ